MFKTTFMESPLWSMYEIKAFIIAHVTRISTTVWGEGYIPEARWWDGEAMLLSWIAISFNATIQLE